MNNKIVFTFIKSISFYEKLGHLFDIVFSDKVYGKNCFILEDLSILSSFNYFYNNNNYKNYIYVNYNCLLKNFREIEQEDSIYLNYYNNTIYFIKYTDKLYKLYDLFKQDISSEFEFLQFLSRSFLFLDGKINSYLGGKIVYPKNKLIYNAYYEKFKNKKYKSK